MCGWIGYQYEWCTPNLPTNIVDVGGFDSSIMLFVKGWNSHVHREFPRNVESSNVSRGNVSREIGHTGARPMGACIAVSRGTRARRAA